MLEGGKGASYHGIGNRFFSQCLHLVNIHEWSLILGSSDFDSEMLMIGSLVQ